MQHSLENFSRAGLEDALKRRGRLGHLKRLFRHHDDLVRTACLLYTLSVVAMSAFLMVWSTGEFESVTLGIVVGAAASAVLGAVFGSAIPMAWARYAADGVLARFLPACQACRMASLPLVRLASPLDGVIRRLVGATRRRRKISPVEAELLSVIAEGEREGVFDSVRRDMIERVLAFARSDASSIMTPRTDIVSIDAHTALSEARALIASSGYSRIPVMRGNIDTIVGILYAKDLLDRAADESVQTRRVKDVCRPPLFVPETKKLDELLREFQDNRAHIAVVLDEYGGTAGLVTIEDVVEEIVGEIADEYERAPAELIRRIEGRSFEVEARVHIRQLNEELGLALPESDDYETLGGFVLARMGSIPKTGESLQEPALKITVLEADPRRLLRLRIDLPTEQTPEKSI
jgi:putative hemolysin